MNEECDIYVWISEWVNLHCSIGIDLVSVHKFLKQWAADYRGVLKECSGQYSVLIYIQRVTGKFKLF